MSPDEGKATTRNAKAGADEAQTVVDVANAVGRHAPEEGSGGLEMLLGVGLTVTVELGRTRMKISDIVHLGSGSVVELQKLASEPLDLFVNDTLFARGEVVVVEDHFAVKITELLDTSAALGGTS